MPDATYAEFLEGKQRHDMPTGLDAVPDLLPALYDFQRDITAWALKRGRAGIFADCGMGKTPMQLEWAEQVNKHTGDRVLIVAPLAVSAQTIREGRKFGIDVNACKTGEDVAPGLNITNYERLHHFDPGQFGGIVIDESGILKSFTGKYKMALVNDWGSLPYRLACTATPAPNDYMELGNHSEFLGAMRGTEMLSSFFINDASRVGHYRVKGHAERAFWEWMASWSVMIRKPSDLGYDDGAFALPPLDIIDIILDDNTPAEGMLFAVDAHTMLERRAARRATMLARVSEVADMVNASTEPWLVWCDLNAESGALCKAIPDAVEVRGSDSVEHKEDALLGFPNGEFRVLVSKPSIAGWGLNYQHCHNMAFTGLSDSYEQFYQALRRCWRFGQTHRVKCYVVTDRTEGAVVENIRRKEADAVRMAENMAKHMAYISKGLIRHDTGFAKSYHATTKIEVPAWLTA